MVVNSYANDKVKGWPESSNNPDKDYKAFIFYHSPGMQENTDKDMNMLVDKIGTTFWQNAKVSLLVNVIIIDNMTEPTEIKKKEDFDKLDYWEQEVWKIDIKKWGAEEQNILMILRKLCNIMWICCHISLQTQIRLIPDFESKINGNADESKIAIEMVLYGTCAHDNALDNIFASMFECLLIKGQ